ncbi:TIGR00296 family protein [archaeon]|nr:TIGR00296 family protein [archaeon]
MDIKQGRKLIRIARFAIYKDIEETGQFPEKKGVFVTLHTFPEHRLRGCIGYTRSIMPLGTAVIKAARAAAYQDPRFPKLRKDEQIVIDVSVLSELEGIEPKPENIRIGKDGLVLEYLPYSGLLLPIVAVEHKFNAERFLEETCYKAGLSPDVLKEKNCKLFRFQTEVFSEESPDGDVKKVM